MAKKKPETKIEETNSELEAVNGELMAGYGMQTVMSIGLEERLQIEDIHDRVLYLDGEVNDDILRTIIMQICKINGEDYGKPINERKPITLIINCCGGNTMIGMALVNTIQNSTTPVIGVCLGLCASMAFGIYAVCHTRVSVLDAVFMVHDGYEFCPMTTATKAQDWAKFSHRLTERYNKAIASRTKFTVKELTETMPHDTWFFADDLVEYDMVDGIIGQDVDLETIFAFMSNGECNCGCEEQV